MRAALAEAGIARKAVAAVGLPAKDAAALCEGDAPRVRDHWRERAALRAGRPGRGACERLAARVRAGDDDRGRGRRRAARPSCGSSAHRRTCRRSASRPGPEIRISLPAYERAFDAKVRLEAGPLPALRHARAAAPPSLPGLRRRGRRRAHRAAARRDRVHHDHHPHPGPRARDALHDRDRRARRDRRASARPGHRAHRRAPSASATAVRWCCAGSPCDPGVPDYGYSFSPADDRDGGRPDEARGGGRRGHDAPSASTSSSASRTSCRWP